MIVVVSSGGTTVMLGVKVKVAEGDSVVSVTVSGVNTPVSRLSSLGYYRDLPGNRGMGSNATVKVWGAPIIPVAGPDKVYVVAGTGAMLVPLIAQCR